jgi:hypothetical protein
MNLGKTVFSQLMSLLPDDEFNKCVARYNGDYRIKEFTCKEHFLVMSFAQLTYRDSLRDIESCLQAMSKKLYHSGIQNRWLETHSPKPMSAEIGESMPILLRL